MRHAIAFLLLFSFLCTQAQRGARKHFYELKVFEYTTEAQEQVIDQFLGAAYIPFMKKQGVGPIGAFSSRGNDTSRVKRIFVIVPYDDIRKISILNRQLMGDAEANAAATNYFNASSEQPAYDRIVTSILEGFRLAPTLQIPSLTSSINDKVYELRSYESASEKKYWKKVEMFNEGGEIEIFSRLQFNPIFYAEVISGPTMPNLVYMTSFENMDARNAHWQAFRDDPQWKALLAMKEYDKTVSKNVTLFLKAKSYSQY
ncbi:MAG: NIPSNAP family protein [Chitinophagaceae bacterium]|jgi:hypothetical protein